MADRAMANPKVSFALDSAVEAIEGVDSVERLRLRDLGTGEERLLPVTGVFEAIGHDPRSELVRGLLDLDPDSYVLTEGRSTRTSIPGVFACGDLVDRTYRQAVTAAGTGCSAALDAEHYLAQHGEPVNDQLAGVTESEIAATV